jgi:pyruvate ferredoxin oxidoreductase gamma subunit
MIPDAIIVQDATLVHQVDLLAGLGEHGYVLINTSRSLEELGMVEMLEQLDSSRVVCCPATEIALECVERPMPNAALLGGLAGLTGVVRLDSVAKAIRERFEGAVGERNALAAERAYEYVKNEASIKGVSTKSGVSMKNDDAKRSLSNANAD